MPPRIDPDLLIFAGGAITGIAFSVVVLTILLLIFGD